MRRGPPLAGRRRLARVQNDWHDATSGWARLREAVFQRDFSGASGPFLSRPPPSSWARRRVIGRLAQATSQGFLSTSRPSMLEPERNIRTQSVEPRRTAHLENRGNGLRTRREGRSFGRCATERGAAIARTPLQQDRHAVLQSQGSNSQKKVEALGTESAQVFKSCSTECTLPRLPYNLPLPITGRTSLARSSL